MLDRYLNHLTKEAADQQETQRALQKMSFSDLAKLAGIKLAEKVCPSCGSMMDKKGEMYKCSCGMMKAAQIGEVIERAVEAARPYAHLADDIPILAQKAGLFKEEHKPGLKPKVAAAKGTKGALPQEELQGRLNKITGETHEPQVDHPKYKDRLGERDNTPKGEFAEKTAADMPPFLKQDRPGKVKEIYKALKRDHPEYSAGKKARIASSKAKKAAVSPALFGAIGGGLLGAGAGAAGAGEGNRLKGALTGGVLGAGAGAAGQTALMKHPNMVRAQRASQAALHQVVKNPERALKLIRMSRDLHVRPGLIQTGGLAGTGVAAYGAGNLVGGSEKKGSAELEKEALMPAALKSGLATVGGALKSKGQQIAKSWGEGVHRGAGTGSVVRAALSGAGNVIKQHPLTAAGAAVPVAYGVGKAVMPSQKTAALDETLLEIGDHAGRMLAKAAGINDTPVSPAELEESIQEAQEREDIPGRSRAWRVGGGIGGGVLGAAPGAALAMLTKRHLLGAGIGALGAGGGAMLGQHWGKQHGAEEAAADKAVSLLRALRAHQAGAQLGYGAGLSQGSAARGLGQEKDGDGFGEA